MSLPALARVDRILLTILLLGALLVALLHWLLAAPEKTGVLERLPSTFFNVGTGAKAAYEVLGELKYDVTRLRRRISAESLEGVGVLFVLRPIVGLAREEVAELEEWVEQGHALVLVPGSPSRISTLEEGPHHDVFLDDWFAWKEAAAGAEKKTEAFPPAERTALLEKVEAGGGLTAGIEELAVPEGRRFDPKSPCRGHFQDAAARGFWKDPQGTIGLQVESVLRGEGLHLGDLPIQHKDGLLEVQPHSAGHAHSERSGGKLWSKVISTSTGSPTFGTGRASNIRI